MNKLLTIGLPTFNRALYLDKQLAWLAQAIKGFERECEIIITDNCSTDHTPQIIEKWAPAFEQVSPKFNRNHENVGVIKNIAYCINNATGRHVWAISDDDTVFPETLPIIIKTLTQQPDLGVLVLNYCSRDGRTGQLRYDRRFDIENEIVQRPTGVSLFEQIVAQEKPSRWGGLALTTALIYRTELAQQSLQEWPAGVENLTLQLVITGYCALHGSMLVTREAHLEFRDGRYSYEDGRRIEIKPFSNQRTHFIFRQAEVPEAFVKLIKLGCDPYLFRRKILLQWAEYKWRKKLRCFIKWPVTTILVLIRYLLALGQAHYYCVTQPEATGQSSVQPSRHP